MPQPAASFAGPGAERHSSLAARRRCVTLIVAVALTTATGAWWHATAAGAAIQNFAMSPTSGPPGTSVHVSGTGCAPGLFLSSDQDFVEVSSTHGRADEHAFCRDDERIVERRVRGSGQRAAHCRPPSPRCVSATVCNRC